MEPLVDVRGISYKHEEARSENLDSSRTFFMFKNSNLMTRGWAGQHLPTTTGPTG